MCAGGPDREGEHEVSSTRPCPRRLPHKQCHLAKQQRAPRSSPQCKTIDNFKAGKFEALNFMSPMGTGKSVLLSKVIREIEPKRVLALTSRVTLAQELENKLRDDGFVSYFQVAPDAQPNLDDEEQFPRVICQLDSIHRLSPALLRVFDLVIMDEACSLLLHFSAGTLRNRSLVLETLQQTLRHAGRIIAMDALWGETEHRFLDMLATPERVSSTAQICHCPLAQDNLPVK